MSRAQIVRVLALVALAAVFVVRSDSRGDGPPIAKCATAGSSAKQSGECPLNLPDRRYGATAVQKALAESAEFNFTDTPLKDVAAFVADHYNINVLLDTKALADANVTPDTPVTEKLKGLSLRLALNQILAAKDLGYVEKDDNLLSITTADVAKTHMTTQIFDVRKFANPVSEFSADPKPWARIAEIVMSIVAPSTWDNNGGAGSLTIYDGNMIVSQTDEIQSQIADLLSQLEIARQPPSAWQNGGPPVTLFPAGAPETKVDQALDSRQDFDFTDTPLKDIVAALQTKLGISMQLDTKALADVDVTADTKLSIKLKQVHARVGLQQLLDAKDLTFIIDHEILLITTADVEKTKTVTYVYPVGDLVGNVDSDIPADKAYGALAETIAGAVAPSSWEANGGAGSIEAFPICKILIISQTEPLQHHIKDLLTTLRAARKSNPPPAPAPMNTPVVRIYPVPSATLKAVADEKTAEQLADMIRKLVEPKSWSEPDAYIGTVRGEIVVRQTPLVHYHIQSLLEALELAPPIKKNTASVQPGATPIGAAGMPQTDAKLRRRPPIGNVGPSN
jgi:hypothetical protein